MRNIGFATLFSRVGLLTAFAWLVRLGCVAVVILVAAEAIWYFVIGPVDRTESSTSTYGSTSQIHEVNTARILATELFGSSEAVEESVSLENLQETTLSLTLEATFVASDDRSHSVAFISNRDGRGAASEYRTGDAVASFAEIAEIHPRFVVISRAGERELLTFEVDRVFSETVKFSTPESNISNPQSEAIGRAPLQQRPSVRNLDPKRLQEASIDDLKPLGLTEIQTSEGSMLAITDSSGTTPLARLGMQPGDIVKTVNGHSLEALRSDQELAKEVLGANTARLEVKRANREFYLTVPMQ